MVMVMRKVERILDVALLSDSLHHTVFTVHTSIYQTQTETSSSNTSNFVLAAIQNFANLKSFPNY